MRNSILFATMTLIWVPLVFSEEPASSYVHTVERFAAAFNAHDSKAMANFVTDDVAWLSICGEDMAVEVAGRSELIASMNGYFESSPTCQSELPGTISTAERVSAIEISTWQGNSGSRSQRSIAVYEFKDGTIKRVYYFPSEKRNDM